MVLELEESSDPTVRNAQVPIRTGRKWQAGPEVAKAIGRLQHQEIVGRVQVGRAGLGWGDSPRLWSKATKRERRAMVVEEVSRANQEQYTIKAVSQGRQGRWTTWEGTLSRPISWADLWKMPQARLSFLLRATYDTLPCPRNLHQWYGQEESCPLCGAPNASLQHLLSSCKIGLTQGRFRWRHDQVLMKLAEILESSRREANSQPIAKQHSVMFVRPGEGKGDTSRRGPRSVLSLARDWSMRADIGKQLQFPREITTTSLRPDIVLWSAVTKSAMLVELTIPWEEGIQAAYERKAAKYADLAAECREAGWSTPIYPVEVGCRGFVGTSTIRLLRDVGLTGAKLRRETKALAEEAEKGSFWLWLRRRDKYWGSRQ
ncbi:uncharacterized protein LOC133546664 [Nerophis ophidion]|uniref:uncharacterized protein LOC133546664 n=1 Tax=Nerophis ophidion TaxID=159077 RepID=UPI002AE06EB5|nr:uncharacterized protein LOC133546598 isoform X2 [Nerophis ophidion]XP_061748432.1 uncharacterized protein LOC133546664 [Nerophis ophidion]